MGKYLKIAREARRQREAEQGIPQPKERPVYWRGMDGQLRGPVTVEEVANTDGTLWVCFTWQRRMFWVQARLIESPPYVLRPEEGIAQAGHGGEEGIERRS